MGTERWHLPAGTGALGWVTPHRAGGGAQKASKSAKKASPSALLRPPEGRHGAGAATRGLSPLCHPRDTGGSYRAAAAAPEGHRRPGGRSAGTASRGRSWCASRASRVRRTSFPSQREVWESRSGEGGKDKARRSSHLLIPVKLFFPFTASSLGCGLCSPCFPPEVLSFSFTPFPQSPEFLLSPVSPVPGVSEGSAALPQEPPQPAWLAQSHSKG